MSRVAQKIPGLYDGLSQQPAALRYPPQCEDQVNCLSSLADGASKRPPSQYVARVFSEPMGEAMVHTINRDTAERYTVVINDGDLKVFDATTGEAKVVGFTADKGYLRSDRPQTGFALLTIADYTFIVNRDVVAKADPNQIAPGSIARHKQQFSDVTRDIDDPYEGMVVEVAGDDRSSFDNYYVIRHAGVWTETARPNIVNGFDAATLPHVLVRNADATFTFKAGEWTEREAGDNDSSPMPSFIDQRINDVYFYRNRLGFLAGQNAILSRSGLFFNFWRETATDILDTDPIDVAASYTGVANLRHAVPFNKTLMLFADQAQFVMNARDVLSPATAAIDLATELEVSSEVKPVGAGSSVFYPTVTGDYAAIREYYVQPDTVTDDADDVTAHVPRYLPADVYKLVAATNHDMLFALAASEPTAVYVYRYYWVNNQRRQSAWNRWELSTRVLSLAVLESYLYILAEDSTGVHLERIALADKQPAHGFAHDILLDRRVYRTGQYNATSRTTQFELPYRTTAETDVVAGARWGADAGRLLTVTERADGGSVVRVAGDWSGLECWIGVAYRQTYVFSEVLPRDSDKSTVVRGRLQLTYLTVFYSQTGYFQCQVKRLGQAANPIEVAPAVVDPETGRIVGRADLTLGEPSVADGWARLPIYSNAHHARIELHNPSHLPSTFALATWEGDMTLPEKG